MATVLKQREPALGRPEGPTALPSVGVVALILSLITGYLFLVGNEAYRAYYAAFGLSASMLEITPQDVIAAQAFSIFSSISIMGVVTVLNFSWLVWHLSYFDARRDNYKRWQAVLAFLLVLLAVGGPLLLGTSWTRPPYFMRRILLDFSLASAIIVVFQHYRHQGLSGVIRRAEYLGSLFLAVLVVLFWYPNSVSSLAEAAARDVRDISGNKLPIVSVTYPTDSGLMNVNAGLLAGSGSTLFLIDESGSLFGVNLQEAVVRPTH